MKFLPLSKESYAQNDHNEFRKSLYGKYDIIVVGSDCVWEWQTVPFPNAYYLCGDYNAVKMSIAASAGTDLLENISPENRILLADAVREFSYVGVRDSATEYILDNVCPDVPHYHNCDPTTILDPVIFEPYREHVRQRLIKAGISMDKPIVGVMGNIHIAKMAREIFGDSVQYVAIYVPNSHCDANLLDLNVMEWGAVFSFFDITFTTFFHGTMLSLVNRTPVMSFDFLPETDKQVTKLHELYSRLDLPDFYWRYKKDFTATEKDHIAKTAHNLLANPPKERIAEELKKEALHFESFLNHITNLKNR